MKRCNLIIVCFIMFVIPMPAGSTPLEWDSPVTLTYDATYNMDLMGGPDGLFHMLFSQDDINSFYYFRRDEGSSYTQLVQSFAETGTMRCSLDFWGNMPTAVYRYKIDQNMEFSIRTGSWISPDEIPGTMDCHAVASDVEPGGIIHVAWVFQDGEGNSILMHSVSDVPEWTHHTVFTIGEHVLARFIDMKLDSTQVAHFTWFDPTYEKIGYAVQAEGGGYDVEAAQDAESCRWIEIDFLSPDLPAIGYLEGFSPAEASLHYAFKLGGTFYSETILDTIGIYEADMAVNREDTITTTEWYFLVALDSGIHYMNAATGGWDLTKIDELYSISTNVNLSADWNSASESVGLAVSDFVEDEIYFLSAIPVTPTPGPTATPEPCTELGCTIEMPSANYNPGDTCYCRVLLCNPGSETYVDMPVFVILDVYGSYFFAPTFSDFDHYTVTLPAGSQTQDVLPEFSWPTGAGNASGIYFYAGMTDSEITELIGDYDAFMFGWSE
jgi:hypothetical protein